MSCSLDDLVGSGEQQRRNGDAERFCRKQINNEIELGGLFDRDIAGLGPAQNLVDQLRGAPKQVKEVRSVGHERSGLGMVAGAEDRRQPRAERIRDDTSTVSIN